MAAYSRQLLSGSTNGRAIPIVATATAGTLLHTAIAGTASFDEVYLWVSNVTAADATLTIEWGGVTNPGDHMVHAYTIPAASQMLPIALGQNLQNGLVIRAFSSVASALNAIGYVNRIV